MTSGTPIIVARRALFTAVGCAALLVLNPAVGASPAMAGESPRGLAASVQPFVDRQELAGAVMLVADRDKVLAVEAVGWADVAAHKPMQVDSLFWIVQHASFPGEGQKAQAAFANAAREPR